MSSTQTLGANQRTPTLAEVIRAGMDFRLRSVNTALPGRIEEYDASRQLAQVRPVIEELLPTRDGTKITERLPILPNVPVLFPRGGGHFITFPLKKGDFVQLLVNQRSIDNWYRGNGEIKNPDDFRTHNFSDAVAIPGFYPFDQNITESGISDNLVIGKNGGSTIHIKENGEIHLGGENAADFVALSQKVLTELNKVNTYLTALVQAASLPIALEPGNGVASVFQAQLIAFFAANQPPTFTAPEAQKVKAT